MVPDAARAAHTEIMDYVHVDASHMIGDNTVLPSLFRTLP